MSEETGCIYNKEILLSHSRFLLPSSHRVPDVTMLVASSLTRHDSLPEALTVLALGSLEFL